MIVVVGGRRGGRQRHPGKRGGPSAERHRLLSATFQVLVGCPSPLPVQFSVSYQDNGRIDTAELGGFPEPGASHLHRVQGQLTRLQNGRFKIDHSERERAAPSLKAELEQLVSDYESRVRRAYASTQRLITLRAKLLTVRNLTYPGGSRALETSPAARGTSQNEIHGGPQCAIRYPAR